jgi:carbon-monoxide dehydrogenase medium subunit
MYASNFNYLRAGSLSEAAAMLKQNPGAKILAGGHSLIPLMKLRLAGPPVVIDIGRVADLKGIAVAGSVLRIGAMSTHAEVAASAVVREQAAALADAAGHVGDPAVRNRGTIGGNVAHADPASDLPTVLTALDASFVVLGPNGSRTVTADRFFQGTMATALEEHDILTTVEVPVRAAGQGSAYVKFEHPASRYAVIGAAARLTVTGGKCSAASVAVGGLVPSPVRARTVERALTGQALSPALMADAAKRVVDDLGGEVIGDIFASAEYRKAVAHVFVERAIGSAAARAR